MFKKKNDAYIFPVDAEMAELAGFISQVFKTKICEKKL